MYLLYFHKSFNDGLDECVSRAHYAVFGSLDGLAKLAQYFPPSLYSNEVHNSTPLVRIYSSSASPRRPLVQMGSCYLPLLSKINRNLKRTLRVPSIYCIYYSVILCICFNLTSNLIGEGI